MCECMFLATQNCQITFTNLHIRWEDDCSTSDAFSMGLFLSELKVETPSESDDSQMCKELCITDFMLYVDVGSSGATPVEDCSSFEAVSHRLAPKPKGYVVLQPGPARNITMMARQNSNPNTEIPALDATVDLQTMHLTLARKQFLAVMAFTDAFSQHTIRSIYQYIKTDLSLTSDYRPKGPKAVRLWWKYALKCVVSDIREKRGYVPRHRSPVRRFISRKQFAWTYLNLLEERERTGDRIEIDPKAAGLRNLEWADIERTRQEVLEYRSQNSAIANRSKNKKNLYAYMRDKERELYEAGRQKLSPQDVVMSPYRRKHAADILLCVQIHTRHFQLDLCSENPDVPLISTVTLERPKLGIVCRKQHISLQVEAWDFQVQDNCTPKTQFPDVIGRFTSLQREFSPYDRVQIQIQQKGWAAGNVSRANKDGTYDITLDNKSEKLSVPPTRMQYPMFNLAIEVPPIDDMFSDVYNVAMVRIKSGAAEGLTRYLKTADLTELGFRGLQTVQVIKINHKKLMIVSIYSTAKDAENSAIVGRDGKTPLQRYVLSVCQRSENPCLDVHLSNLLHALAQMLPCRTQHATLMSYMQSVLGRRRTCHVRGAASPSLERNFTC